MPVVSIFAIGAAPAFGQNTSQLSENGWFSDDTRADGLGAEVAGTNLISDTLTDDPEAGASGSAAHNADIQRQISFGAAPGVVPAGTHRGAVHLTIGATGAGKSQISDRKDDGVGHADGADAFGAAMTMEYSWMGMGTPSVTASVKFGVKTADFGSTGVSSRTGENVWDKIMIYEPGSQGGVTSDGTWQTETVDYSTGLWWFFDRTAGAASISTPMTLADMSVSGTLVGGGPKTIADVYALITAPGAIVTCAQVGVGSGNAGADVYLNQIETNFYRSGSTTTFGNSTVVCDQNVTNNAIFGSGNINGSFTVDRNSGVELGLRGKLRFGAGNQAENVFNSNGDGTYSFDAGFPTGGGLPGWAGPTTPFWSIEWSANSNFDGSSAQNLDALTYELGMDFDPGPGTDYLVFDPMALNSVLPYTPPAVQPFWDHSLGDNSTAMGAGVEAGDAATYAANLAIYNLAQNSWTPEFFNNAPFDSFDPTIAGRFDFYLAAFDGGVEVARTQIAIVTEQPTDFDQNVTNNVIMGSGIGNGSFTTRRGNGVELGIRTKTRFDPNNSNLPGPIYNSNGDGTYTFQAGSPTGPNLPGWASTTTPFWAIEWSANTDYDGSTSQTIDALTYEIGMDFDPTANADYLVFDPIALGSVIPYTAPAVVPFWDHSVGNNGTVQSGGAEAGDAATYAGLLATGNLIQNSWSPEFFNEAPFNGFDPLVAGRYDFYLAAFENGVEVLRTEMVVVVTDGPSLTLEASACQTDQDCNLPGVQIEVDVYQRNLGAGVTGFQGFLSFDTSKLTFEAAASSYSAGPFGSHIQSMPGAEVMPGELRLDGSVGFNGAVTTDDALLATLVFTVANECDPVVLNWDATQGFASELSLMGSAIVTDLTGSPSIIADATPPVLDASPDILVAADASVNGGCDSAVVTFPLPGAMDSCSAVTVECFPPSGTAFPAGQTTTVTCVATDACGNTTTNTFDVTVSSTNVVMVNIQLVGVTNATTRCIHFVADNCTQVADVDLAFDATGAFSGLVEIPCGTWSQLCAKDEQHTLWDTTSLTLSMDGTYYIASTQLDLSGGDTDNDGDVDINDVTWFMFQFGGLANSGGCPWDGTRDADFSNNGAVQSEDYTFLTSNWLNQSDCACMIPFGFPGGGGMDAAGRERTTTPVREPWQRTLDADKNGRLDHNDVRAFEDANGLPTKLSEALRKATPTRRR